MSNSFRQARVFLYNPDEDLTARGINTEEFSRYINALVSLCNDTLANIGEPEDLDVVVALRSRRRSRVWFVTSGKATDPDLNRAKIALESVPAPEIASGSIVFALSGAIGGGKRQFGPEWPFPDEWKAKCPPDGEGTLTIDALIDRVWPEEEVRGWRRWLKGAT